MRTRRMGVWSMRRCKYGIIMGRLHMRSPGCLLPTSLTCRGAHYFHDYKFPCRGAGGPGVPTSTLNHDDVTRYN